MYLVREYSFQAPPRRKLYPELTLAHLALIHKSLGTRILMQDDHKPTYTYVLKLNSRQVDVNKLQLTYVLVHLWIRMTNSEIKLAPVDAKKLQVHGELIYINWLNKRRKGINLLPLALFVELEVPNLPANEGVRETNHVQMTWLATQDKPSTCSSYVRNELMRVIDAAWNNEPLTETAIVLTGIRLGYRQRCIFQPTSMRNPSGGLRSTEARGAGSCWSGEEGGYLGQRLSAKAKPEKANGVDEFQEPIFCVGIIFYGLTLRFSSFFAPSKQVGICNNYVERTEEQEEGEWGVRRTVKLYFG
ncbi:hypothetical protein BDZ91DRAFT_767311 [Kalaharituber pfeilii]|nr:hypothetical protein BDZ91DRAFT_767311 [Kalaharituber pfeilii]